MKNNATKKSHYVPVFMLNRWRVNSPLNENESLISSYSWHEKANKIINSRKGPKGFCSTEQYYLDKSVLRPDLIENKIFTPVDNEAAVIIKNIIDGRKNIISLYRNKGHVRHLNLNESEKISLSKFILSLIVRNPFEVYDLIFNRRTDHENLIFDNPKIMEMFSSLGTGENLEEFLDRIGLPIQRLALFRTHAQIQGRQNGLAIKNKTWGIIEIHEENLDLLLSDSPVQLYGNLYEHTSSILLPISPSHLLAIIGDPKVESALNKLSAQRIIKLCNKYSASTAMRYVFSASPKHESWLKKYLEKAHGYPWDNKNKKMFNM